MSGYADELDGFGLEDDELGYDAADELEDEYLVDPVGTLAGVVQSTAAEVEARVRAQVEAEVQRAQAERQTTIVREADEAMRAKYGETWAEQVPSVADVLRYDAGRGALPTHDALELARHLERTYLAERERSKPSKEEADAAHWAAVKSVPGAKSYADTR
jgi:hypothetical protein